MSPSSDRRRMRCGLLACALALASAVIALPARAQPAPAALQALLDGFVRDQRLPGGVLAVLGPQIDVTVASGVLDRRSGTPVRPDSRFYIASSGKMATAVAVLQLVDDGSIRLDQPIAEIIDPAGALARLPNWRSATVEQLLNHTSGMPDYFDDAYEKAAARDRRMLVEVERALAGVIGQEPDARPGAAYDYSNTNYALLGLLLERVDKADLRAVLSRRVFSRAGMSASTVGADPKEPGIASAHGENGRPSAQDNLIAFASRLGDGPVTTTAGDMTRFLTALIRDARLLKPATLQRMLAPSRREKGYGLGIEISRTEWGPAYGHNGSVTGFKADAWYYADRRTAIVFVTNGEYRTEDADMVSAAANLLFGNAAAAPVSATASAADLCTVGARLEVLSQGEWYPATVRAPRRANGRCPIRYDGYGSAEDESVPARRMRAAKR